MGRPGTTMLLPLLFGLLSIANGYMIDSSCDSAKDEIVAAADNAFSLAAAASSALSKSPLDDNVKSLAGYLFTDSKLTDVSMNFIQVGGMALQLPVGKSPISLDPTIYCDFVHLDEGEQKDSKGKVIKYFEDKHQGWKFQKDSGDKLSACMQASGGPDNVMAVTTSDPAGKRRPFITLCPWYLNKMTKGSFPTSSKVDFFGKLGWGLEKVVGKATRTEMDALALLDHTLLHEFTHTNMGGTTKDHKYEWSPCVGLGDKGAENADSYAFFGLGVDLIKKGSIPQKNGSIKPDGSTNPNGKKMGTKKRGQANPEDPKVKRGLRSTHWVA